MHPGRRMHVLFQQQHARYDDMSHHEDREIGRRIVGPVSIGIQSALRTYRDDRHIAREQMTLPASRATPADATQKSFPEGAGRRSCLRPIGLQVGLLQGRYVHGFNFKHEWVFWSIGAGDTSLSPPLSAT